MSAYVVEDETINLIVAYLEGNEARSWLSDTKSKQKILTETYEQRQELAERMFAMNVRAVKARYADDKTEYGFTFWDELPPPRIQAYKSLQCFIYQCSEGDVPNDPLYIGLEAICAGLANLIVSRLPEYDKAVWG